MMALTRSSATKVICRARTPGQSDPAMVELKSEGQTFDKPAWLGKEVTGDPKYYNANLVKHPYSKW